MRKISKRNNPIRQHYVPQVYLKHFCNSVKAIAVIDKHNQKVFSTGIRAVGAENDFYTLEKMNDPYYWEHVYADGMEPLLGQLIERVISQSNLLVRNGTVIISDVEKVKFAIIMVMQLLRGKQSREYERKLYQKRLPGVLKKAQKVFGPLSDEQDALLEAFAKDDYYFKRTSMDVSLDSTRIERYAEIICNLDFVFYRIQGDVEFITSDNPVMLINCITNNARPFANGLLQKTTVICYPISPKLLLCAMHPEMTLGIFHGQDCCLIDLDANTEVRFISTVNRNQIEQCSKHAFARSENILRQYIKGQK